MEEFGRDDSYWFTELGKLEVKAKNATKRYLDAERDHLDPATLSYLYDVMSDAREEFGDLALERCNEIKREADKTKWQKKDTCEE